MRAFCRLALRHGPEAAASRRSRDTQHSPKTTLDFSSGWSACESKAVSSASVSSSPRSGFVQKVQTKLRCSQRLRAPLC